MRALAGTAGPQVPYLPAREPADRGPAGSLVQARDRHRLLRRSERRPAWSDWRSWVGGTPAALAPLLLAAGGGGVTLGVLVAAGALAVVSGRYRPGAVEVELTRQITRERRCARELEQLRALGWTVLSDRLLPGTEHRLGHCWSVRPA